MRSVVWKDVVNLIERGKKKERNLEPRSLAENKT